MNHVVDACESIVEGVARCVVRHDDEIHIVREGTQSLTKRLNLRFTSDAELDIVTSFEGRQGDMSADEACSSGDEDG